MRDDREHFHLNGIDGWWSRGSRTVFICYTATGRVDGETALALLPRLSRWAATGRVRMLVDASKASPSSMDFRWPFLKWLREHRGDIRIAVARGNEFALSGGPIVALLTGIDLRSFKTREEAEGWLQTWPTTSPGAKA